MTAPSFPRSEDAKKAGWFSKRHQTSEPHRQAVAKYKEEHGKRARQRRVAERNEINGDN